MPNLSFRKAFPPHPAAENEAGRTWLVLVMVVVAVLSAAVAFGAAVTEEHAAILAETLSGGHILEITERQDVLSDEISSAVLGSRRAIILERARMFAEQADAERPDHPGFSDWLDLKAQEEFAAARAIRSVSWLTPDHFEDGLTVEESLQKTVAGRLARRGFQTTWSMPPPSEAVPMAAALPETSIWDPLERRIEARHSRVPLLALGVVFLVAALVIFTVTDSVFHGRGKTVGLWAGIAVAAASTGYVIHIAYGSDRPYGSDWLAFAGGFGLLVLLGLPAWFLGVAGMSRSARSGEEGNGDGHESHPVEPPLTERGSTPFGHLGGHHARDVFSRLTIVVIAFTVLLSAIAGYGYNLAQLQGEASTRQAFRYQIEMASRNSHFGTVLGNLIDVLANVLESRTRLLATTQRIAWSTSPETESLARADQVHARDLRQYLLQNDSSRSLDMINDPQQGDGADLEFPKRAIFSQLGLDVKFNKWEPYAMWDAARGDALAWHRRATSFLFTLTLFAVALYLLGQGLGIGRSRAGGALVGVGAIFMVAGILWGLDAQWDLRGRLRAQFGPPAALAMAADECRTDESRFGPEPRTPNERAAHHYAIAEAMMTVASNDEEYDLARANARCAVRLRPDFADAHRALAEAELHFGSSELASDYVSLPAQYSLDAIISSARDTLRILKEKGMERPSSLLSSFAFDNLLDALAHKKPQALTDSVEKARQSMEAAEEIGQALPGSRFVTELNLALALLATSDFGGARAAYEQAIYLARDPTQSSIASGVTDLETLAAKCENIADAAQCTRIRNEFLPWAKERFLHAVARDKRPMSFYAAQAKPGTVELFEPSASAVGLAMRTRLRDFDPAYDKLAIMWYAYEPEWQSWRNLQDVPWVIPPEELDRESDGTLAAHLSYINDSNDQKCLGKGDYRAELYVDGKLADVRDFKLDIPVFVRTKYHELNMELCRPGNWKRWLESDKPPRGDELINGFFTAAANGKPAGFLFTFYAPRIAAEARSAQEKRFVKQANESLVERGWVSKDDAVLDYQSLGACRALSVAPGNLVSRSWSTRQGMTHVAVMLAGAGSNEALCETLDSVETYYSEN